MADAAKRMLVELSVAELDARIEAAVARAMVAKVANEPDSKLLTTTQAAEYLGISRRVLLGHVSADRLVPDSPQRPGFSSHRFKRSTLDAFMVRR